MQLMPPFILKRQCLYWLDHMVSHYNEGYALEVLWWQASISPDGINERLTRANRSAAA
jgi:hypothetical protein